MITDYPQHLIRRNHALYRPTRMLFLDTETKTLSVKKVLQHRMQMAWTCYRRIRSERGVDTEKWHYWQNAESLWRYAEGLAQEKTVLYIFAHNIFFDLQCSDFFYHFTRWGWVLQFLYDKGLTYILTIRKGRRSIKCLSTTNYFPYSLKKLGSIIGQEKLEVDFAAATRRDLKKYCRRDTEIVVKTMEKYFTFINKHDLGKFAASRSGQAFTAYRHRFMDNKIYTHRDEDLSAFERRAYFGGRVECFEIGEIKRGPFVHLDVNSMYSYVMRTHPYPIRLMAYEKNCSVDRLRNLLKKYCVVARVGLDTDEPAYGVLRGHKLVFPVGRFTAHLCTPGLAYALSHGHLLRVDELTSYERDSIFIPYVDYFSKLKTHYSKTGNTAMLQITKDFLNHLYGKFAQKTPCIEEEEDITFDGYFREEIYDMLSGKTEVVTKLMNKRFLIYGEEPAKNSMVAIAAHVTEHARFRLWELMRQAGRTKVLYCDTDSIKLRQRDYAPEKMDIDPHRLGALKVEGITKKLHLYAPKYYTTEKRAKIKGVPLNAEKLGPHKYRYTTFPKQASHLNKQITRFYYTEEVIKILQTRYTKGIVTEKGKILPQRLNEF